MCGRRPVKALQKNSIDEQGLGSKILRFQSDWEAHYLWLGRWLSRLKGCVCSMRTWFQVHSINTKQNINKENLTTTKTGDLAHLSATLVPLWTSGDGDRRIPSKLTGHLDWHMQHKTNKKHHLKVEHKDQNLRLSCDLHVCNTCMYYVCDMPPAPNSLPLMKKKIIPKEYSRREGKRHYNIDSVRKFYIWG